MTNYPRCLHASPREDSQNPLCVFRGKRDCGFDGRTAPFCQRRLTSSTNFLPPLLFCQVNYVVKGGQLYQPGEVVPGQASVVSRFLNTGYLWDTVRVMGGAYGGFTRFNPVSGLFSCMSYRDPNLAKTLDNYDGCSGGLLKKYSVWFWMINSRVKVKNGSDRKSVV